MASWIKCTTADGTNIRVNMDNVAVIRPHASDRGGTGNEIIFVSGFPSSIVVKENQDYLARSPYVEQEHGEV